MSRRRWFGWYAATQLPGLSVIVAGFVMRNEPVTDPGILLFLLVFSGVWICVAWFLGTFIAHLIVDRDLYERVRADALRNPPGGEAKND